jgi:deubiquitinating protein VCIP135
MKRSAERKYLTATCPNTDCKAVLLFPTSEASVECPQCGERNDREAFIGAEEYSNPLRSSRNAWKALASLLYSPRRALTQSVASRKAYEMQKINGVSGYECKLLSPLLTKNGMDKSGAAVPLTRLNQKDVFDCAALCDR